MITPEAGFFGEGGGGSSIKTRNRWPWGLGSLLSLANDFFFGGGRDVEASSQGWLFGTHPRGYCWCPFRTTRKEVPTPEKQYIDIYIYTCVCVYAAQF